MRFCRITYPFRAPQLALTGTVQIFDRADESYGGQLYCIFKPAAADIPNLEKLENLLNPDSEMYEQFAKQIGFEGGFEHRPTMTENYQLRLKMNENDDGTWKFETSITDESDAQSKLFKGTVINVVLSPGFYFNDSSKTYGLYYTLKSLNLEPPPTKKLPPSKIDAKKVRRTEERVAGFM